MLANLKRSGAGIGFAFFGLSFAQTANAEVVLLEKDGWTFSTTGRIGAFVHVGMGDDFPIAEPTDPAMPNNRPAVMGTGGGRSPDEPASFGWQSERQADAENKFFGMRVRSGFVSNVLGFALARDIDDATRVKGLISIWAPIESLGRDKWYPVPADIREAFLTLSGRFGEVTAGRNYALIGRTSYEIDYLYGHGFSVGFPCADAVGPSCGQVGVGALHPGFGAGLTYKTPNLGGVAFELGLYDPVRMASGASATGGLSYERVPFLRPEAALTFDTALGTAGKLKIGVEGAYQPVGLVAEEDTDGDPATPPVPTETNDSIWAVSGGARIEVGPVRLGAAVFHGKGVGLTYAFQSTDASGGPGVLTTVDPTTGVASQTLDTGHPEIRAFTGAHGQAALVFGKLQIGAGGGIAMVDQIASDPINAGLSVGKQQVGISVTAYYHLSDAVVLGADYMRFMATWRGSPATVTDPNTMAPVLTGQYRAAEEQALNFISAGVTYHW